MAVRDDVRTSIVIVEANTASNGQVATSNAEEAAAEQEYDDDPHQRHQEWVDHVREVVAPARAKEEREGDAQPEAVGDAETEVDGLPAVTRQLVRHPRVDEVVRVEPEPHEKVPPDDGCKQHDREQRSPRASPFAGGG